MIVYLVIKMSENKRYIDGGEECVEDQFLIDTETDENFFIDHGLDKIIERLNEQEERIQELETVIQQILYETRANYTKGEYSVIVSVSPEMHNKLSNLIKEGMW